jgi:lipoprotein signal peptidase
MTPVGRRRPGGPAARVTACIVLVAVLTVIADHVTKELAHAGRLRGPWIEPVTNPALALGVAALPAVLELACGIALLGGLIVWMLVRPPSGTLGALAAGLLVGGSLGNLLDRAGVGTVRDLFVGPGLIFNVADVALVVGLSLMAATTRRRSVTDCPAAGR